MDSKVRKMPQDDFLLKPSSLIYLAGNMPAVQRRAYNAITKEALRSIRSDPKTMQVVRELKELRKKKLAGRDEKRKFIMKRDEILEKIPNRFHLSARTISRNIGYKYETKEYNKIYNELKKLCNKSREWNLIGRDRGETRTTIVLLSEITLVEGMGLFGFEIPKTLLEIFLDPRIYARLETIFQNSLTSGYATFWYEMFADYEFSNKSLCETPWLEIDLCRKLTGVEEGEYKEFKDFRKWVITKPTQEITKKTCYRTHKILTKKQGRTVTAIKIQYARKLVYQQPLLDIGPSPIDEEEIHKYDKKEQLIKTTSEHEEIILEIIELTGMSDNEAHEIIKEKDLENVRESIEYAKRKNQAGEVKKSFGGFVRRAIERDWGVKTKQEREQEEQKVLKQKEFEAKEAEENKQKEEADKRINLERERQNAALVIFAGKPAKEKEIIFKSIRENLGAYYQKQMDENGEKSMAFKINISKVLNDQLPPELRK
ncbi:MAG: replication initiation protein [Nitrospinae bacterium]|nr:replication initiation protein [Nitrospinota bacterium]